MAADVIMTSAAPSITIRILFSFLRRFLHQLRRDTATGQSLLVWL